MHALHTVPTRAAESAAAPHCASGHRPVQARVGLLASWEQVPPLHHDHDHRRRRRRRRHAGAGCDLPLDARGILSHLLPALQSVSAGAVAAAQAHGVQQRCLFAAALQATLGLAGLVIAAHHTVVALAFAFALALFAAVALALAPALAFALPLSAVLALVAVKSVKRLGASVDERRSARRVRGHALHGCADAALDCRVRVCARVCVNLRVLSRSLMLASDFSLLRVALHSLPLLLLPRCACNADGRRQGPGCCGRLRLREAAMQQYFA